MLQFIAFLIIIFGFAGFFTEDKLGGGMLVFIGSVFLIYLKLDEILDRINN